MRNIILVAAVGVLAACQSEPAEEPRAEEAEVAAAPEPAATVANGSQAGTYEVTAADGSVTRTVINPDGTYVDLAADGSVETEGTFTVTEGKTCFSPTTEGAEAMCFTESAPGADGSFTATPDSGDPVTVRPLPDAG